MIQGKKSFISRSNPNVNKLNLNHARTLACMPKKKASLLPNSSIEWPWSAGRIPGAGECSRAIYNTMVKHLCGKKEKDLSDEPGWYRVLVAMTFDLVWIANASLRFPSASEFCWSSVHMQGATCWPTKQARTQVEQAKLCRVLHKKQHAVLVPWACIRICAMHVRMASAGNAMIIHNTARLAQNWTGRKSSSATFALFTAWRRLVPRSSLLPSQTCGAFRQERARKTISAAPTGGYLDPSVSGKENDMMTWDTGRWPWRQRQHCSVRGLWAHTRVSHSTKYSQPTWYDGSTRRYDRPEIGNKQGRACLCVVTVLSLLCDNHQMFDEPANVSDASRPTGECFGDQQSSKNGWSQLNKAHSVASFLNWKRPCSYIWILVLEVIDFSRSIRIMKDSYYQHSAWSCLGWITGWDWLITNCLQENKLPLCCLFSGGHVARR